MTFWTLSRKMNYEEHKKAEEDAVIRVMGEVLFEPSVTWWKDLITTSDFGEITKYLEEHHDEIKQFRLGGIDIPDPDVKRNDEQLEKVLKEVNETLDRAEKIKEFHCGFEESGGHAYNCNDCPNKCDEWYQWDKELKEKGDKE